MTTALLFGMLTVALVGPVPALLSRATWTLQVPRAAMTLWQAIALAAVLSAFSCGLAIATQILTPHPGGLRTFDAGAGIDRLGLPLWLTYLTVFALTLLIGARLAIVALRGAVRTRSRRAAHRQLIDLLARHDLTAHTDCADRNPLSGRDVRMLEVATPLAYCLPGIRPRVVLSEGVVSRLSRDELAAVIAHERAHLRARHDLVLEAFIALHTAFPRFVRSDSALDAVRLLVEVLADDQAVRATGPRTLGRALVACADATAPRGAMAVGGPTTITRVRRLAYLHPAPGVAAVTYCLAFALIVVPTLAVAIPWLNEVNRLVLGWGL